MRMTAPPQARTAVRDTARHFANSVEEPFEYSLRDLDPSDMVGVSIHNADNQQNRPVWMSFRKRDQISRDVMWSVFDIVTQSNALFTLIFSRVFGEDAGGV